MCSHHSYHDEALGRAGLTLSKGRSGGEASGDILQAGRLEEGHSYPGNSLHPTWRGARGSVPSTHWAPGGERLEMERLLRVRGRLLGQGLRRGLREEGTASRWTLKEGRSWVCGQAVPLGEKRRGVSS